MIIILLPAFNEEESVPILMPKLRSAMESFGEDYRIVVCNDGSRDSTQTQLEELAKTMPLEIIQHKFNRGLGETSRDLFEYAAAVASDGDVIVRLDCDDTHEPEFIPHLVKKVRDGYDVVIASRFATGGGQLGVSGYRSFVSHGANLFLKVFFPIRGIREYSCGFRAYRGEKIKEAIQFYGGNFIQLNGLGFTCTLEKLIKLKLIGARFGEEPFVLRYDQKQSTSKMVTSVTTLGYIIMTVVYYWPWGGWRVGYRRKLASFYVAPVRP